MTEKGQVTIPAEVRSAAGIGPGTELEWHYDALLGRVVARKAGEALDEAARFADALRRIDSVAGSADAGLTTDEVLRITRGDRD